MKFAVYGTLRRGYGNNSVIQGASFVGEGLTQEDYRLTANGIPFVSRKEAVGKVKVEVFETEDQEIIDRVDSLEGHPRFYKREEIPVVMEGGEVLTAELYFCEGRENLFLIESGDYADYRTRR